MANNMTAATMKIQVQATNTKAVDIYGSPAVVADKSTTQKITVAGTGSGQGNLLYTRRLAIAASGSASIDLSGSLTDLFGDAAVFAKVKGLLFHNLSGEQAVVSAAKATLSGNFLNAVYGSTASLPLENGDFHAHSMHKTGITVTNTSADTITVTNNSGTEIVTVDVFVYGNA